MALVGIEKLLPRFSDLSVFLSLTTRAATGQRLGTFVSLIQGPRRPGEPDGPEEVHVIFVDNGAPSPAGPADLNGDGIVNGADLGLLLGAFGSSIPAADLNCDGVVNVFDLLELLAAWGPCDDCPPTECAPDFDDNCVVNVFDLLELLANWG